MEGVAPPPITPSPSEPTRLTVEQYLALAGAGDLTEADRVELLKGVIGAMTPSGIRHSSGVARAVSALEGRAVLHPRLPLRVGLWSLPEPDVAVVPGALADYDERIPETALLVLEVSDATLKADRLSKSRIYAAGAVLEYWIVDLRENVVEVLRDPDPAAAIWRERRLVRAGDAISLAALPDVEIRAEDLLPRGE